MDTKPLNLDRLLFDRHDEQDQEERDAELIEKGAAEKPLAQEATDLIEEDVIKKAFNEARMDIVSTDFDSSLLALEVAILKHAKEYDKEKRK